jgi:anti-anti-sigma factor
MDIRQRLVGDVTGRMDWGDRELTLTAQVESLLGKERSRIVVNLEGVPFIDTKGLAELVASHVTAKKRGGELKLAHPQKHPREVLSVTKLDRVLGVFGSEREALGSFPPSA